MTPDTFDEYMRLIAYTAHFHNERRRPGRREVTPELATLLRAPAAADYVDECSQDHLAAKVTAERVPA